MNTCLTTTFNRMQDNGVYGLCGVWIVFLCTCFPTVVCCCLLVLFSVQMLYSTFFWKPFLILLCEFLQLVICTVYVITLNLLPCDNFICVLVVDGFALACSNCKYSSVVCLSFYLRYDCASNRMMTIATVLFLNLILMKCFKPFSQVKEELALSNSLTPPISCLSLVQSM